MSFDPREHLIKLPRRVKDKAIGQYITVYDDYLEVKWRLVWFRERYPRGVLTTEELCVDLERGYARYRATVEDGEGGRATGHGTETAAGFADYVERAETRAIGRALAALGIGTAFVGQDITEGEHVADAPVAQPNGQPDESHITPDNAFVGDPAPSPQTEGVNGSASTLPTTIPADGDLPCAGQEIASLKPPQLAMLISKVATLAHAEGAGWAPLLAALQSERARRLASGQRKPRLVTATPEEAVDVP